MKSYIKPEVKVYKVRIEPLLSGSVEGGQIEASFVKKYDHSLFDEEMMTEILVASAVFGMTKTLKIE